MRWSRNIFDPAKECKCLFLQFFSSLILKRLQITKAPCVCVCVCVWSQRPELGQSGAVLCNSTQIRVASKRYFARKCLVLQLNTNELSMLSSSRGRVVKALDSKSNGVSPRRFESCRLRNVFITFVVVERYLGRYLCKIL